MDRVDQPIINSPSSESKIRTPAYANFDSNTDKLLHLLQFILTGVSGFKGEFETKFAPEVMRIAKEIAQIGRPHDKEVSDQDVTKGPERDDLIQKLSDALVKPFQQFTDGFLTVREWIPVLMVTTVEAYLKDVLIYAAKVDHAIMESSEQSASYAEVKRAQSLEELTEELQSRWARNFVDDGGPDRWIKRLTKMGARGYRPETADEMETLWGVRHLLVHSVGVGTPDFVRRHPEIGIKVGESILIRSNQLTAWIKVASLRRCN